MITDLLPVYYEAHKNDPIFTILRSIVINGHEVAWMELKGEIAGEQHCLGRQLYCECNFTKGVGWHIQDTKVFNSIDEARKCLYRKAVCYLRSLELRKEYLDKFNAQDVFFLTERIPEIVSDLIEKVKAGEFIGEDGTGAAFWGGYFYLQTLAEIVDLPMDQIWKVANVLVKNKNIDLEGAVVQLYREPPTPAWDECFKFEYRGWVGKALLPAHSKMPQAWKFEVLKPDGKSAYKDIPDLPLTYNPTFGPDVADIEAAKKKLQQLVEKAMRKRK